MVVILRYFTEFDSFQGTLRIGLKVVEDVVVSRKKVHVRCLIS